MVDDLNHDRTGIAERIEQKIAHSPTLRDKKPSFNLGVMYQTEFEKKYKRRMTTSEFSRYSSNALWIQAYYRSHQQLPSDEELDAHIQLQQPVEDPTLTYMQQTEVIGKNNIKEQSVLDEIVERFPWLTWKNKAIRVATYICAALVIGYTSCPSEKKEHMEPVFSSTAPTISSTLESPQIVPSTASFAQHTELESIVQAVPAEVTSPSLVKASTYERPLPVTESSGQQVSSRAFSILPTSLHPSLPDGRADGDHSAVPNSIVDISKRAYEKKKILYVVKKSMSFEELFSDVQHHYSYAGSRSDFLKAMMTQGKVVHLPWYASQPVTSPLAGVEIYGTHEVIKQILDLNLKPVKVASTYDCVFIPDHIYATLNKLNYPEQCYVPSERRMKSGYTRIKHLIFGSKGYDKAFCTTSTGVAPKKCSLADFVLEPHNEQLFMQTVLKPRPQKPYVIELE